MKHRALVPALVATLVAFSAPAPASVGSEATDFSLPAAPGHTFRGRFRMADHLRRRPVVMLFWATWCQPCLQELPIYQALSQRYGNQLTVVGVSMDGPDTVAEAGATARRMGITFPIVTDLETQVVTVYNPRRAAPFSVWINRQGIIAREREGFAMAEVPQIQSGIAELVAPPRRPGAPVAPPPGAPAVPVAPLPGAPSAPTAPAPGAPSTPIVVPQTTVQPRPGVATAPTPAPAAPTATTATAPAAIAPR